MRSVAIAVLLITTGRPILVDGRLAKVGIMLRRYPVIVNCFKARKYKRHWWLEKCGYKTIS